MDIDRREFILAGAAAAAAPVLGAAAGDAVKRGPLGKIVGKLPPGRYDCHQHVYGSCRPDPEGLAKSMASAGLKGGVLFSQCSGDWHPMWVDRPGHKAPSPETIMDTVIAWCAGSPTLYPFYWIEPDSPTAMAEIDLALKKGMYGFKVMRPAGMPLTPAIEPVYRRIAETGKPTIFHTGILWDHAASSQYFRPTNWEAFIKMKGFRFAAAHISWPWVEECVALFGKLLAARDDLKDDMCRMFIDTTPGTPPGRRRAALELLYTIGWPLEQIQGNVMFGTDCFVNAYDAKRPRLFMDIDDKVYRDLKLSSEMVDSIYRGALENFLFG